MTATLEPTGAAVAGLAKLIRETLRAYPVSDLAKMVMNGRDRYQARFRSEEGGPDLFICLADGSLWASRDEATAHLLNSKAIETYYAVEVVEVSAPAGNFNVVAVCGMSGKILGPPNHHEYQLSVARHHAERFSHMSLDQFKSRISMESGEEVIEKWKAQVSQVKQYRLKSAEEPESNTEEETVVEVPSEETSGDTVEEVVAEEVTVDSSAAATEIVDEVVESGDSKQEDVSADGNAEPKDDASEEDAEEVGGIEETPQPEAPNPVSDDLILKSDAELAAHFKKNFADDVILKTREAVVPGDIPAKSLSRGLLVILKQESEKLRRGFPLPMIQALCRAFEKKGLKFFKQGKKALHVSMVRPKAVSGAVSLTDQIQAILDHLSANPRCKVIDLLDALASDFTKPEKSSPDAEVELTDGAKVVLSDLRWLAAEGYVIEFPDTRLVIGKVPGSGGDPARSKKKSAKKKAAKKKSVEAKKEEGDAKSEAADPSILNSDGDAGEISKSPEEKPSVGVKSEETPPEDSESQEEPSVGGKSEETPSEDSGSPEEPLVEVKSEETSSDDSESPEEPSVEVKSEETPPEDSKSQEEPSVGGKSEETPSEDSGSPEEPLVEVKSEETSSDDSESPEEPSVEVKSEETPSEDSESQESSSPVEEK